MTSKTVEYCEECSHHRITNDSFFFCIKADSETGKSIPTKNWVEGIIPDWCPLPEETIYLDPLVKRKFPGTTIEGALPRRKKRVRKEKEDQINECNPLPGILLIIGLLFFFLSMMTFGS